jgi:hypothetical protein
LCYLAFLAGFEELSVLGNVVSPLLGEVFFRKDGRDWAFGFARATVDALFGIYSMSGPS